MMALLRDTEADATAADSFVVTYVRTIVRVCVRESVAVRATLPTGACRAFTLV